MEKPKGIYRSRCIGQACGEFFVTFAPLTLCEKCRMPVTQIDFKSETDAEIEETIDAMAVEVIQGFDALLQQEGNV